MQVDTDQTIGQNERTALYRHLDKSGRLLYVGISLDAIARLNDHIHDSAWSRDISMVVVTWFDTRSDALEAERLAIISEKPLHNKQHNKPSRAMRESAVEGADFRPIIVRRDRPINQISRRAIESVLDVIDRAGAEGSSRPEIAKSVSRYLTKNESMMVVDNLIECGNVTEITSTTSRGGRPGRRLFLRDEVEGGVVLPLTLDRVRTRKLALCRLG